MTSKVDMDLSVDEMQAMVETLTFIRDDRKFVRTFENKKRLDAQIDKLNYRIDLIQNPPPKEYRSQKFSVMVEYLEGKQRLIILEENFETGAQSVRDIVEIEATHCNFGPQLAALSGAFVSHEVKRGGF